MDYNCNLVSGSYRPPILGSFVTNVPTRSVSVMGSVGRSSRTLFGNPVVGMGYVSGPGGYHPYATSHEYRPAPPVVVVSPQGQPQPPSLLQTPNNPVEFTSAISYVNKIKLRFFDQPEKYKQFLEILNVYQKDQKNLRENGSSVVSLTEHQVLHEVTKLFEHHEDLLREFEQFLPEEQARMHRIPPPPVIPVVPCENSGCYMSAVPVAKMPEETRRETNAIKVQGVTPDSVGSSAPYVVTPQGSVVSLTKSAKKKSKYTPYTTVKRSTLAPGQRATYTYKDSFERARNVLRSQGEYGNFLKILMLLNQRDIEGDEAYQRVSPLFANEPRLLPWLKKFFMGDCAVSRRQSVQPLSEPIANNEDEEQEHQMEINLRFCKQIGHSYHAVPEGYVGPKCSGRTALCDEVLNDVWVSVPKYVTDGNLSKVDESNNDTPQIERCEEERFELDLVLETTRDTILCFERLLKKMNKMSQTELQEFHVDDGACDCSFTTHRVAIKRLYGDKMADNIIRGIRNEPCVSVSVVLRRLKAKLSEWIQAQGKFKLKWSDQMQLDNLKSLNQQGC